MKVIVENLAIEYRDEGQGTTLLILHGWMNDLHSFDALAIALKNEYRIVRLDLPGFGGSETPPNHWHVVDYAHCVQKFVSKIGLTDYALVGHSFGGRVALKGIGNGFLAPSRLVLIDSAGIVRERTLRNRLFTLIAKIARAVTLVPPVNFFRQPLRRRLYNFLGSDYFAAGALSGVYLNVIGEDLSADAAKIVLPTLLIWGSEDASTPLEHGKRISRLIQGSKLQIIDGAGHAPHIERPEDVVRMIKEFI